MKSSKNSVLASVGTEAFAAAGRIAEEPASAVGSSTASRVNETRDFGGEALPDCSAESYRTVSKTLLRKPEMKRHAGQVFGDFVVEAFAVRRF